MEPETRIKAVSVAVMRGETILLVKRAHEPAKGQWAFPGGRVEPGETLAEAAAREVFEECGLAIRDPHPITTLQLGAYDLTVFRAICETGDPVAASDAAEAEFLTPAVWRPRDLTASTRDIAEALLTEM